MAALAQLCRLALCQVDQHGQAEPKLILGTWRCQQHNGVAFGAYTGLHACIIRSKMLQVAVDTDQSGATLSGMPAPAAVQHTRTDMPDSPEPAAAGHAEPDVASVG